MEQYYKPIRFINIKSLRDFILDNDVSENDSISLNTYDFDNVVLEHRNTYGEALTIPYIITGVLIKADEELKIPMGRVLITKNDDDSYQLAVGDELPSDEPIFRCGKCGNIVDYDGAELAAEKFRDLENILNKYQTYELNIKHVLGYCCRNSSSRMY